MVEEKQQWYQLSVDETFKKLGADREGLTSDEAKVRLERHGYNQLTYKRPSVILLFLRQFHNPLVYILLAAAVITSVLTLRGEEMLTDTIVIIGVVILNAGIGFFQEGKTENALEALRKMIVTKCVVLRDGEHKVIPSRELVPGDVVFLEGGNRIPADLRLFHTRDAHADEAALTGESLPVEKNIEAIPRPNLAPGDQTSIAFSGTFITRGAARGIVVETGESTEFGKIARLVKETRKAITPLQRKIASFTRTLMISILAIGIINFILGYWVGVDLSYSFLASVSLVVAAIPEMLPMIVTGILALAGAAMVKKNALVRRLPAVETLGTATVICSDKTGTLTKNEMTVIKIFSGSNNYDVSGVGYEPDGNIFLGNKQIETTKEKNALTETLRAGYLCNDAKLSKDESGRFHIIGDPTEGALIVSATKAGISGGLPRLDEIPFDSERMFMATLHEGKEENIIYVKGSPEKILSLCSNQFTEQGIQPLQSGEILENANGMAAEALRLLAMAFKTVSREKQSLESADIEGLTFLGIQGMIDPPRKEAIEAIRQCDKAGIRSVMITGDHVLTATAIARQLGIISSGESGALTGEEMSVMSDEELGGVVDKISVYARVAPEHKLRIARQLQKRGQIVAMTGDGVNDAPALKAADIGIAMGITGTEVSKEAADMILTDDNFASIVGAIEEGRHAWNNLEKAVLYTLPTNSGQALLVIGALLLAPFIAIFSVRLPLEPVMILWVNLFDSVFLTMPLMMEPKNKNLLDVPPRDPGEKLANPLLLQRVILIGLAIAIPTFLIYNYFGSPAISADGLLVDSHLLSQAQTAAFWAVLMVHFGFVMSARSIYDSAFSFSPFSNKWLLGGIVASIALRFLPTFVPAFSHIFRTADFPLEWWLYILPCVLPGFIALEADKLIRKKLLKSRTQSQYQE
ncbi:MAG: HAD-IC family P-type ATPase [Dehalococcoidales bacterium]